MTRRVIYPFLLAAFPVVRLAAQNAREVRPAEVAAPLAVALAIAAGIWLMARWALRDGHRAGPVAAAAMLLLLDFDVVGPPIDAAASWLSDFWVQQDVHVPAGAVLAAEAAAVAGLGLLLARRPKEPARMTPFLNLFAAILLALPLAQAIPTWARIPRPASSTPYPALAELPKAAHRPDIYNIVLDGFARGDVLKKEFGYDIEPFLARLESRGFYVSRQATANYCQTPLSLSSSLNGTYLLPAKDDAEAARPPDKVMFRDNAVMRSLRPLGYRFVSFASGFAFTEFPENDVYLAPHVHLDDFHRMVLDATPARLLWPNPESLDPFTLARERTLYLLDKLPGVAKDPAPTFTLAHVVCPHPPFVFGAEGEDVSPRPKRCVLSDGEVYEYFYGGPETYVPGYRKTVEFLVHRVERVIDEILANSSEPPIIILQSDHGSGLHLNMQSADRTDHHERMGILAAVYLPGGGRAGLTDAIAPVNLYRIVFNNEFGTKLPLLHEECYYSSWPRPFDFVRVTDAARGKPPESPPVACDLPPKAAPAGAEPKRGREL